MYMLRSCCADGWLTYMFPKRKKFLRWICTFVCVAFCYMLVKARRPLVVRKVTMSMASETILPTQLNSHNYSIVSTQAHEVSEWKSTAVVEDRNVDSVANAHKQEVLVHVKGMTDYVLDTNQKNKHQLTVNSYGGLGNQIFQFASLYGIAKTCSMIPVLPENSILRKFFKMNVSYENETNTHWYTFEEFQSSSYDDRTNYLNYELDIKLVGFFQSWKYFVPYAGEIRRQLRFDDHIVEKAEQFMRTSARSKYPFKNANNIFYIGVHIRRGDMLDDHNIKQGYTVADELYVRNAMLYFNHIYRDNVLFMVCTDDDRWSRYVLADTDYPVMFSLDFGPEEDLALLSLCNHSVITVGTYGWWAAWLAGGQTFYFSKYPEQYSFLADQFTAEDYYPEEWTGL